MFYFCAFDFSGNKNVESKLFSHKATYIEQIKELNIVLTEQKKKQ